MARLSISTTTLKQLFALSGNQCAFPGCKTPLVNEDNNLLGEVCHINAANPAGQRFDSNQTDEARRGFENLLLLCPTHHKVTDNIKIYPASVLRKMKHRHENRFKNRYNPVSKQVLRQLAEQSQHQLMKEVVAGQVYTNHHGGTIVINQGLSFEQTRDLLNLVLSSKNQPSKSKAGSLKKTKLATILKLLEAMQDE
jgi:hypothetical protein